MSVALLRNEVGIVVALPAEASSLGVGQWRAGACVARPGGFVAMAGIGRERAASAARQLLDRGMRMLLSWGVAGALAPSLHPGDVLLPQRVMAPDGEWPVDASLRARLAEALLMPVGDDPSTLWCSADPVMNAADKRTLAQRNLAAVDMESAGVASVAADAGVPFAALKAICDPAVRAVPAAAPGLLRGNGRLRLRGLLGAAAGGPRVWRELNQLRQDFDAAHRSLCRAARRLPMGTRA